MLKTRTECTAFTKGILILVDTNGLEACLFVDQILGQQPVVIKGLSKFFKDSPNLSGCTILGDGSISLILDVGAILEGHHINEVIETLAA